MSEAKRETKKFIARGLNRCSFYYAIVDENGKPIPEIHEATGQPKYVNNKMVYREQLEHFESSPIDKKKPMERSCFYILHAEDPLYDQKLKGLRGLADNPAHAAMAEEDDFRVRNPEAFEETKRRKQIEAELEANRKAAQDARVEKSMVEAELMKEKEKVVLVTEKLSDKENELAKAKAHMDKLMNRSGTGK